MEINGYWERSSLTLMIFLGLLFVEGKQVLSGGGGGEVVVVEGESQQQQVVESSIIDVTKLRLATQALVLTSECHRTCESH